MSPATSGSPGRAATGSPSRAASPGSAGPSHTSGSRPSADPSHHPGARASHHPAAKPAHGPAAEPAPGAAAARPGRHPAEAAGGLSSYAARLKATAAARLATARTWGLAAAPLIPPPPPAVKPVIPTRKGFEAEGGDPGLPPVFTRIPTKDKIVFITIDDGSEKEPQFIRMMSALHVPYSAFLSDYLISDDYGYFTQVQASGVTLSNHTLTHPYLPGLTYAQQKHEICDQQDKLAREYGKRPTLFRPPYGNYNGDTLRIARSCGIKAFPLWETEAFPTHMDWRDEAQHFEPGDIILTHFQGLSEWNATMVENIRNLLKRITDQGYAVARLEDYV
ncbi:polysaccharide deacetylase family protein [Streptomyces sp. NBC_01497]|uniref:polysaccharide deacetylase family protein n=1 Tax=Streptomyces sp. NBC_01497 TaxID=2903885 RepID=UPI003FCDF1BB